MQEIGNLRHIGNPQTNQRENTQRGVELSLGNREMAFGLQQLVKLLDEIRIQAEECIVKIAVKFFQLLFERARRQHIQVVNLVSLDFAVHVFAELVKTVDVNRTLMHEISHIAFTDEIGLGQFARSTFQAPVGFRQVVARTLHRTALLEAQQRQQPQHQGQQDTTPRPTGRHALSGNS